MCGPLVLCMGNRFCAWATVFVRGQLFRAWRSFPCIGRRLDAWMVVGISGVVVARGVVVAHGVVVACGVVVMRGVVVACGVVVEHGVVVLWFSWDDSGLLVLAVLKNNNKQ